MANVTQYHVLCYGTSDGYQDNRAQIQLMDGSTVLGWVRFHDSGMPFPNDTQSAGKIIMHLPSTMFQSVLDILRNEKPITISLRVTRFSVHRPNPLARLNNPDLRPVGGQRVG
jgi:hypothetical protein